MIKRWFQELQSIPSLKWIKALWLLLLLFLFGAAALIFDVLRNNIPSFSVLENPQYKQASEILDVNKVVFGVYYVENRIPVSFDEINAHIKRALIETEDVRFYEHTGIDLYALFRVFFKTILLNKSDAGGGSTISQQLAKQLFERPNTKGWGKIAKTTQLIKTKIKEWIIAVKLEKSFTKEEIMAMYLNKFEFINGAHGIHAAAKIYFNKDQKELNVAEAATLVGMLKNPSLYNPVRFGNRARERRNTVLKLLQKSNYLSTRLNYDSLLATNLDMSAFKKEEQSDGPAPYFRAELTKWLQKLIHEKKLVKADGQLYDIYTDGLKIYTTLDLRYQQYAEEASKEHMHWLQERYFRKWKGIDPWTFEADSLQLLLRKESLMSKAKASPRYLNLRAGMLEPLLTTFTDLNTSDNVLEILIASDTNEVKMRDLVEKSMIAKEDIYKYNQLKNNELYKKIKQKYQELQAVFQRDFSTPVLMKIYDDQLGEKEVTMTPMDSVRYSAMHLQNAVLAIDPGTSSIKAWVGGINHRHFKFDHVTSRRSVGSTMKPFVYTAAMQFGGILPCQEFEDIQYTIAPGDANFNVDKEWTPNNATEKFTGNYYNLYHGLVYSKNSITVRLLKEMGTVDLLRNLLDKVGISKDEKITQWTSGGT